MRKCFAAAKTVGNKVCKLKNKSRKGKQNSRHIAMKRASDMELETDLRAVSSVRVS